MTETRLKLQNLDGQRLLFSAKVERFGSKSNGWHQDKPTVCLVDIQHNCEQVADHLWMNVGKAFAGIREGDRVAFMARVSMYEKGYKGGDGITQYDWGLKYPTKLEKLIAVA